MMVNRGDLTPQGKDWFIAAVDPMHDTQLSNLGGWPDLCDQASLIRCFKKTHTISPDISGGNWDLMLMTLPDLKRRELTYAPFSSNKTQGIPEPATTRHWGGLTWATYVAGGEDSTRYAIDKTPLQQDCICLSDEVLTGNGRLIGMGFEVNNTTAEIYKQGTVHVFRQPQQFESYNTFVNVEQMAVRDASGTAPTVIPLSVPFSGRYVQKWPKSEADVTLLSGTRTWKASDGCYCVVPFQSESNPIYPSEYTVPVIVEEFPRSNEGSTVAEYYAYSDLPVPWNEMAFIVNREKWAPTHSAGALFVGLSPETTLTVTVNYYYEYFPASADETLITLAKPSAGFDPVALALYSKALSTMPVGVPANMNGFGDWFAGVVSKFAPSVGAALMPFLGPGSAAFGLAAKGVADSYLTTQSPKSKPIASQLVNRLPPVRENKPREKRKQNSGGNARTNTANSRALVVYEPHRRRQRKRKP